MLITSFFGSHPFCSQTRKRDGRRFFRHPYLLQIPFIPVTVVIFRANYHVVQHCQVEQSPSVLNGFCQVVIPFAGVGVPARMVMHDGENRCTHLQQFPHNGADVCHCIVNATRRDTYRFYHAMRSRHRQQPKLFHFQMCHIWPHYLIYIQAAAYFLRQLPACTSRSALPRSPEGWAPISATVACICCPCTGCYIHHQGGTAFLPLNAQKPSSKPAGRFLRAAVFSHKL